MKTWTFICAGRNRLAQAERQHVITCHDPCRVRAHRDGSAQALRTTAATFKIDATLIVQAGAIDALCPDLHRRVATGDLKIKDAQSSVNNAFVALPMQSGGPSHG